MTNNWKEIKRERKRRGLPLRVASGFFYGVITLVVMSGLVWLAWRAY